MGNGRCKMIIPYRRNESREPRSESGSVTFTTEKKEKTAHIGHEDQWVCLIFTNGDLHLAVYGDVHDLITMPAPGFYFKRNIGVP
jgi:hypothetical protein